MGGRGRHKGLYTSIAWRQLFDSNASSDKSFKFKIGKGKVIKVCLPLPLSSLLSLAPPPRVGMRGWLAWQRMGGG